MRYFVVEQEGVAAWCEQETRTPRLLTTIVFHTVIVGGGAGTAAL